MFPTAATLPLFCSLALSLALTACESDPGSPEPDPDPMSPRHLLATLSTPERELVKNDNGFGFRLSPRSSYIFLQTRGGRRPERPGFRKEPGNPST